MTEKGEGNYWNTLIIPGNVAVMQLLKPGEDSVDLSPHVCWCEMWNVHILRTSFILSVHTACKQVSATGKE